tara:strand:+ start:375 stop:1520 length:1146 start_codon:yes stop_codon:yes gene_type:complete
MKKIIWVNFLHIYQPPWQDRGIIEQVSIESYEYILTLLEKYNNFKVTLNITGNLIEQLEELRPDLIKRVQFLFKKNKIELTSSSKYHALLPLLPPEEIKRQIELNKEVLIKYFDFKKIKGFYLPEMAFNLKTAKIIKKLGFKYIILDQINYKGKINNSILYKIKNLGLIVIFRNRRISKSYPPEIIYNILKNNKKEIIITGTDGEIYGHQHEDWQGYLEKILKKNIKIKTISQYIDTLVIEKEIVLRPGSWESTHIELKNKKPFVLWNNPYNKIHKLLWELTNFSIFLNKKYKKDKNYKWSRLHLDKGLSSCSFWWASGRKLSAFSPLSWNPEIIDNGIEEIIRSIRSLNSATIKEKVKAEKIYANIKKVIWETHWKKYNK